jgi:uncharacterized protein (DUF4415 family)
MPDRTANAQKRVQKPSQVQVDRAVTVSRDQINDRRYQTRINAVLRAYVQAQQSQLL